MFDGLPSRGLVIVFGPPASGKTTFARLAFAPANVLSTDDMRALVGGSADNIGVTTDAHRLLADIAAHRLREGLLTVVDSTGTDQELVIRLEEAAARTGADVRYVRVEAPLEECLERNARRTAGRVPDAAVEKIAREVDGLARVLEGRGVRVAAASSCFAPQLRGRRAFLAIPITEFLAGAGFRADKRELCERIHAALGLAGMRVSSAALNEGYGTERLAQRDYASYDVREIRGSDCLLVCTTSSLSPDTYLEIGVALGAGKPIGIVLPEKGHRAGMLRGLTELGNVLTSPFATDAEIPRAVLAMAARLF